MEPFAETCKPPFSLRRTPVRISRTFSTTTSITCVYETLHRDIEAKHEEMSTDYLLRTLEPDYKVVLVGDARMAPQELYERWGAILLLPAQRDRRHRLAQEDRRPLHPLRLAQS